MPLKRIRKQSQANDLLGSVSQSWKKGHSVSGATSQASMRYPDLSVNTINKIAQSQYAMKAKLDDIFSGSLTQFANLQKTFDCPSGHINFAVQLQFIDDKTGQLHNWGTDIVAALPNKPMSLATLIKDMIGNILEVIKEWNYKVKEYDPNATIAEFIYGKEGLFKGSAFEIHGFECLP